MSEQIYTRESLIKSKRFAMFQKDFLAAVLSKQFYTMKEAEKAVEAFFGKEAK